MEKNKNIVMTLIKRANGKYCKSFTKEETEAIYTAIHSGDRDLRDTAIMTVIEGLKKFMTAIVRRYNFQITPQAHDLDDYIQEMTLKVVEKIDDWDPEKLPLISYFWPYFNRVFIEEKAQKELTSGYDQHMKLIVHRAIARLEEKNSGNRITLKDIQEETEAEGNRVSIRAIKRILDERKFVDAVDIGALHGAEDPRSEDAFNYVSNKEEREAFAGYLSALSETSREVIEKELQHMELQSKMIDSAQLRRALSPRYDHISDTEFRRIRKEAEQELRNLAAPKFFGRRPASNTGINGAVTLPYGA